MQVMTNLDRAVEAPLDLTTASKSPDPSPDSHDAPLDLCIHSKSPALEGGAKDLTLLDNRSGSTCSTYEPELEKAASSRLTPFRDQDVLVTEARYKNESATCRNGQDHPPAWVAMDTSCLRVADGADCGYMKSRIRGSSSSASSSPGTVCGWGGHPRGRMPASPCPSPSPADWESPVSPRDHVMIPSMWGVGGGGGDGGAGGGGLLPAPPYFPVRALPGQCWGYSGGTMAWHPPPLALPPYGLHRPECATDPCQCWAELWTHMGRAHHKPDSPDSSGSDGRTKPRILRPWLTRDDSRPEFSVRRKLKNTADRGEPTADSASDPECVDPDVGTGGGTSPRPSDPRRSPLSPSGRAPTAGDRDSRSSTPASELLCISSVKHYSGAVMTSLSPSPPSGASAACRHGDAALIDASRLADVKMEADDVDTTCERVNVNVTVNGRVTSQTQQYGVVGNRNKSENHTPQVGPTPGVKNSYLSKSNLRERLFQRSNPAASGKSARNINNNNNNNPYHQEDAIQNMDYGRFRPEPASHFRSRTNNGSNGWHNVNRPDDVTTLAPPGLGNSRLDDKKSVTINCHGICGGSVSMGQMTVKDGGGPHQPITDFLTIPLSVGSVQ